MVTIRATVTAQDFETAKRMLLQSLNEGIDSISNMGGSTWIEVMELDATAERIVNKPSYSKLCKEGK